MIQKLYSRAPEQQAKDLQKRRRREERRKANKTQITNKSNIVSDPKSASESMFLVDNGEFAYYVDSA